MATQTDPAAERPVYDPHVHRVRRRHLWAAIIAGVLVALGVQLLLGTLGMAIGLTVVDPAEDAEPFSGVGMGAGIWWVLSSIIALFVGGWAAGRMGGIYNKLNATLQGLVTWSLATLIGLWMIYSAAGAVIGGAWQVTATAARQTGQLVDAVVPDQVDIPDAAWQDMKDTVGQIRNEAMDMVEDRPENQAARRAIREAINEVFVEEIRAGNYAKVPNIDQQDRQTIVDAISENTEMSQAQARQRVDRWVEQYRQMRTRMMEVYNQARQAIAAVPGKAKQYAGMTTDALASAAWWSFIMLLLSAAAAAAGSAVGAATQPPADRRDLD